MATLYEIFICARAVGNRSCTGISTKYNAVC